MTDAVANLAVSLVATAPSPATSGISLVVTAAEGAVFPAVPFEAIAYAPGVAPTRATAEIVLVTARSTDTLTITRAQGGTTAKSIAVGWIIADVITQRVIDQLAGRTGPLVYRPDTDVVPLSVRHSAAGQTAHLQDWRSQADVILSSANELGQFEEGGRRLAPLTARLAAAATSTSVTYATTGLQLALKAGGAYIIKAFGQYRSAATTTGLGLQLAGISSLTATRTRGRSCIWGSATSGSTPQHFLWTALAQPHLTTATFAATTDYWWELDGEIVVNAAGILDLQFRTEIAASTVTIQPDSVLMLQEVA